jgi:type I restriction enzyme, R subunit
MIAQLPTESAGVREHGKLIDDVGTDFFWEDLTLPKLQLLTLEVAPLMRFLPGVDLPELSFRSRILEFVLATTAGDEDKAAKVADRLRADVARLPLAHSDVAPQVERITRLCDENWPTFASLDDLADLDVLAGLMRHRIREGQHIITLNLEDTFKEKRWLVVGPDATEFDSETYREEVEKRVRKSAETHPAMLKLTTGQPLTEGDVAAIEGALDEPDLWITEESLQRAYEAPHGSLLQLLKHVLGLEELQPREDAIKAAFESFIADHGYLDPEQILFVRLFAARLSQAGRVAEADLLEQPFTLLTRDPTDQIPEGDLNELFELAAGYQLS